MGGVCGDKIEEVFAEEVEHFAGDFVADGDDNCAAGYLQWDSIFEVAHDGLFLLAIDLEA